MLRALTGWTALILILILATLGTVLGNGWFRRLGWSGAALVALVAAWHEWRS